MTTPRVRRPTGWAWLIPLAALCAGTLTSARAAELKVSGPIAALDTPGAPGHDYPFFSANRQLATQGYVEEEFFVEGAARALSIAYGAEIGESAIAAGPARPFKTRILVRRPVDGARFNGVVLVEWFNDSNRFDADNVWLALQEHLLRAGYAWVGVSTQGFGGVETLKSWSPKRYGDLAIVNDGRMAAEPLSLDIFHQVAAALEGPETQRLLGGLEPRVRIATGQSQSAIWLASYINGGLSRDGLFNGFLLVSATGARIDPAVSVPVLRIVAEGDAAGADAKSQAPDSLHFRQWEIAGSSHVDRNLRAAREPVQLRDLGVSVQADIAPHCDAPSIGTTTSAHSVIAAGLDGLVRWSLGGAPPPSAPRLERTASGVLARDTEGFAQGGVRPPEVLAPLGLNVGTNAGAPACGVQGSYQPYDLVNLRTRYARASDYVRAVQRAVRRNVRQGFLLPIDGEALVAAARRLAW
jgi:hypothetical protein